MTCCDHGYGRPSWRPWMFLRLRSGQAVPATHRSGTPRLRFWISDLGSRIFLLQLTIQSLLVQISPFVLWISRAFLHIFNPNSAFPTPQSSTRWHSHLRGLATAIHAISELDEHEQDGGAKVWGEVQVLDVSSCFF